MSTDSAVMPVEGDAAVVEQRLAELWSELTPAQQALLDTIITAGIAIVGGGDTAGYSMPTMLDMQATIRSRTAELQEDWRRTTTTSSGGESPRPARRWNLRPALDWFRGATAAPPQARPQGG